MESLGWQKIANGAWFDVGSRGSQPSHKPTSEDLSKEDLIKFPSISLRA
jgi:hypothetical protein